MLNKLALDIKDREDGRIDISTYGDLTQETPATMMLWMTAYVLNSPAAQHMLHPHVVEFRKQKLAEEAAQIAASDAVDNTTDVG